MKETVSGCFFSEHSVFRFLRNIDETYSAH